MKIQTRANIQALPLLLTLEMLRKDCPDIANSEILMVGDSMEKDIVPVKELG